MRSLILVILVLLCSSCVTLRKPARVEVTGSYYPAPK